MAKLAADQLQLGIIGLGPMWRRQYRPAVLRDPGHYHVSTIFDAVYSKALNEAKKLSCIAAESVTELVRDDRVAAILLLDPQWFGLWPIEVACRHRKPILIAPSLQTDISNAKEILDAVEAIQTPVYFAQWPVHTPAYTRLRVLLDKRLGTVQLITGELAISDFNDPRIAALVEWAVRILACSPSHVQRTGPSCESPAPPAWQNLLLEFPGQRACQLTLTRSAHRPTTWPELHIIAEHGEAWIRFPNRLRWRQRRRSVQERIRSRWTVEAKLLREFRQFCQNQSPPSSDLTMARICAEIWKRI